jgi:hypothetical protein
MAAEEHYYGEETRCHRSVLKALLQEHGANVAS